MDALPNGYPWNTAGSRVSRSGSFWGAAQISVAGCSGAGSEVRSAAGRNTKGHPADQRYEDGTPATDARYGQPAQGSQQRDGDAKETE